MLEAEYEVLLDINHKSSVLQIFDSSPSLTRDNYNTDGDEQHD